ncbi:MAG TPA: FG-GAP-like repeat-containing protein [Pyrinomonadaceae bacterium]|jgi:uncharacterized delta-60 repeat protein
MLFSIICSDFFRSAFFPSRPEIQSKNLLLPIVLVCLLLLSGNLARAARPGTLDTTFGSGGNVGFQVTDYGPDGLRDVLVQPDGKIIAVGMSRGISNFMDGVITIARCNRNGSPDTSFGTNGVVITNISPRSDFTNAVALQPDGKIVVAGESMVIDGKGYYFEIVVARYTADGTQDSTFGGGLVRTLISANSVINDVAIQPDGKILIAGGNGNSFLLMRFNSNSTRDATFGTNGVAQSMPVGGTTAYAMGLQTDGKIVLAGDTQTDGILARYNPDGSLDNSFGTSGVVSSPIGTSVDIYGLTLQTDGKILITGGGRVTDPNYAEIVLLRFNTNGSRDTSFDGDGLVTTKVPGASMEEAYDVAIERDGKIVIIGSAVTNGIPQYAIIRYLPGGALDASFDGDGIAIAADSPRFSAMAFQPDGKLVTAGGNSPNTLLISRYNMLGNIPFDFDGDGKTDISIFRPSSGQWWYAKSSTALTAVFQFGQSTDKLTPGDFTGDGKTDIAFWRPSTGEWFILRSEDSSFFSHPFGTSGDVPAAADFDGDGITDEAVFRPTTSTWYILRSTGGVTIQQFGASDDLPIVADYDGDGKADMAIFRPSTGVWWINRSSAGQLAFQFGTSSDKIVQGDYTGDGKTDAAFYRPSTGFWYVLRSEDYSFYAFPYGAPGDAPAPGDYDGDGLFDAAVFRPSNTTWYVRKSTGSSLIQNFGQAGDVPVPSSFIP